jgi:hypothetical protein
VQVIYGFPQRFTLSDVKKGVVIERTQKIALMAMVTKMNNFEARGWNFKELLRNKLRLT